MLATAPRHDGALYRFPVFGLLATGVASVGLGLARRALDEVNALVRGKRSKGGKKTLAESELTQVRLARAEGELRAARALMRETLLEVTAHAEEGALTLEDRARLRLAATHAAEAAARSVDVAYHLAGGSAVWTSNPLQRCFRDVHVMTQHIMVSEATLKPVGRILLGLPTDVSQV